MGTYLYIKDSAGTETYSKRLLYEAIVDSPLYCNRYRGGFEDNLFTDVFKHIKDSSDYYSPIKVDVGILRRWFKNLCIYGIKSKYPYQPDHVERQAEAYYMLKDILKLLKARECRQPYVWLLLE